MQNIHEISRIHKTSLILCIVNSFGHDRSPLRILTLYYNKKIDQMWQSPSQNIMEMYLYSQKQVFFSNISTFNLNKQLTWNEKSLQLVKKSLNGKNSNTVIQFNIQNLTLKFYEQFNEKSIRILLFQSNFINLHRNPLVHAQQMLKQINTRNSNRLKQLKQGSKLKQQKLEKIESLNKEMIQLHQFEIDQIKERFIKIVNETKKKLRPHLGIQMVKEQQQDSQTRTIYRIKSGANNGEGSRPSQNLMNLFQ